MADIKIKAVDYVNSLTTVSTNAGAYAGYSSKVNNTFRGNWLEYRVVVPSSGLYRGFFLYTNGGGIGLGKLTNQNDNVLISSFYLDSIQGYSTVSVSPTFDIHLNKGIYIWRYTPEWANADFVGWELTNILPDTIVTPDISPSYRIADASLTEDYRTFSNPLGERYEEVGGSAINAVKQSWQVTFIDMTYAEAITLRNLIRSAQGVRAVTWIPPMGDVPLKWRIRSHSVNMKLGLIASISCKFEQVY